MSAFIPVNAYGISFHAKKGDEKPISFFVTGVYEIQTTLSSCLGKHFSGSHTRIRYHRFPSFEINAIVVEARLKSSSGGPIFIRQFFALFGVGFEHRIALPPVSVVFVANVSVCVVSVMINGHYQNSKGHQ
jgi:hypothetical protein